MAAGLSGQLQQLVGLANSTDGSGNYLFSGFQANTPHSLPQTSATT